MVDPFSFSFRNNVPVIEHCVGHDDVELDGSQLTEFV